MKRAPYMSPFPLVPRGPLGPLIFPSCHRPRFLPSILAIEVEQEQRPRGNGDREAIVVGAGLCDGEGERAYTEYAPTLEGESTENFARHSRKVKIYS